MACNNIFEQQIGNCVSGNLHSFAKLEANQEYVLSIKDKFGNIFNQDIVADVNGEFDLNVDSLPQNLFNPYAGNFFLTAKKPQACVNSTFLICEVEYTAIKFSINLYDGDEHFGCAICQ